MPFSNRHLASLCREEAKRLRDLYEADRMGDLYEADLLDMAAFALERSDRKREQ